jgi:hypothetical protein
LIDVARATDEEKRKYSLTAETDDTTGGGNDAARILATARRHKQHLLHIEHAWTALIEAEDRHRQMLSAPNAAVA